MRNEITVPSITRYADDELLGSYRRIMLACTSGRGRRVSGPSSSTQDMISLPHGGGDLIPGHRLSPVPCRRAQVILAEPPLQALAPRMPLRPRCRRHVPALPVPVPPAYAVEWWCPFLMPLPRPRMISGRTSCGPTTRSSPRPATRPATRRGWPTAAICSCSYGVLPGDGTRAVASLITNQASFRVLDAIADVLTAQVAQFDAEVVIGVPTLGLPLAEGVARRLGHPRMVALSTSRKFWYDEGLSEPLSSITSPEQSKRVYLDPRSLALLADRRILLVDDVLSTGTSLSAVLRLLVQAGRPPTAIGVAMTQTQAWRAVLGQIDSRWPTVVRSAMSTPLLVPHEDGGWRPEAVTAVRGMDRIAPADPGRGRPVGLRCPRVPGQGDQ